MHRGADGFVSEEPFGSLYSLTLKAVPLGLMGAATIPCLLVQGAYDQRLDTIADPDIPAGHMIWMLDQTDIEEVKKRLGVLWRERASRADAGRDTAGGLEYARQLIEDVAQGGGFILSTGAVLDDTNRENLHALIEAGKEYGVYC